MKYALALLILTAPLSGFCGTFSICKGTDNGMVNCTPNYQEVGLASYTSVYKEKVWVFSKKNTHTGQADCIIPTSLLQGIDPIQFARSLMSHDAQLDCVVNGDDRSAEGMVTAVSYNLDFKQEN